MQFFHATELKNLSSILHSGLIPQIGERSKLMNEKSGVFLFKSQEDMENALGNWLGDYLDEEDGLVLLSIEGKEEWLRFETPAFYEICLPFTVVPEKIHVLKVEK